MERNGQERKGKDRIEGKRDERIGGRKEGLEGKNKKVKDTTCSIADRGAECNIPYDDLALSSTDNGWDRDVERGSERGRTVEREAEEEEEEEEEVEVDEEGKERAPIKAWMVRSVSALVIKSVLARQSQPFCWSDNWVYKWKLRLF